MNARATCPCSFKAPSTAWRSGLESPHHTRAHAASGTTNRKKGPGRNRCRASEQGVDATIDPAGRTKGRDAFRRGQSRPGRNRTCNPRFWRPVLYQLSYGPRNGSGLKLANPRQRGQAPRPAPLVQPREPNHDVEQDDDQEG